MEPNRWQHSQRVEVLRAGQWWDAVYIERGETTHMHYVLGLDASLGWCRVGDAEIRTKRLRTGQTVQVRIRGRWRPALYMERCNDTGMHYVILVSGDKSAKVGEAEIRWSQR